MSEKLGKKVTKLAEKVVNFFHLSRQNESPRLVSPRGNVVAGQSLASTGQPFNVAAIFRFRRFRSGNDRNGYYSMGSKLEKFLTV